MGCHACVLSRKDEDFGPGRAWQEGWANERCPNCGQAFNVGDRIVVDEDSTVYHYDCFEGPKPAFVGEVPSAD